MYTVELNLHTTGLGLVDTIVALVAQAFVFNILSLLTQQMLNREFAYLLIAGTVLEFRLVDLVKPQP